MAQMPFFVGFFNCYYNHKFVVLLIFESMRFEHCWISHGGRGHLLRAHGGLCGASPAHHCPTTKLVILEDVSGSGTLPAVSPHSNTSVRCAQHQPALICEENKETAPALHRHTFCSCTCTKVQIVLQLLNCTPLLHLHLPGALA